MCMHKRIGWLQAEPESEPYYGCLDCGKPVYLAPWAQKFDLTRHPVRVAIKLLA